MRINPNERLVITGGTGMVGSALVRYFSDTTEWKNTEIEKLLKNIIIVPDIVDLRDEREAECFIKFIRPTYIIHLAAKVGGVKTNSDKIGDFYSDNTRMNTNVLYFAHKYDVRKVLSFLSTCVYPDGANYPLTEDQIHNGPPHYSNFTYAYAKRMLDVQSRAYRQQFDRNYITVIPNNIMGINDNFDLNDSHVVPAIIRKIYEAKLEKTPVTLWGDGQSLREFTFSDDMAKLIMFMFEHYNGEGPINIGNSKEYSIKEIVEKISKILKFDGQIIWDESQPAGQHRKPSSTARFKHIYGGEFEFTPVDDALKTICNWFVKSYPNVRGVIK